MTDDDRALLDFEEAHPRNTNRKEALVSEQFGIPLARYYQRLLTLLKEQEVVAAYPQLAKRIKTRQRRGVL